MEIPENRAAIKWLNQWIHGNTQEQRANNEVGIIKELEIWLRDAASHFGYDSLFDFTEYVKGIDFEDSSNMYEGRDILLKAQSMITALAEWQN